MSGGQSWRLRNLRKLSDAHVAKLRLLLQQSPAITTLAAEIHTSEETLLNALTGATFKPATVERLEAAIDERARGEKAA